MTSSFYNGVSGLKTHQFGMDVWADNISNINNVGFKASRPEFSNIFSQTLANSLTDPSSSQVGLGSSGQTTSTFEKEGGYTDADNPFDMALVGEGWFGTMASDGTTYYTRNGEFNIDANGNMVATNGNILLGTVTAIQNGTVAIANEVALADVKSQQPINLPQNLSIPATPTTYVNLKANLNPDLTQDYVNLDLSVANFTTTVDSANSTVSISGNVQDVENLQDAKSGDTIFVTLTDDNGTQKQISTTLDDDLNWSIESANLGNVDSASLSVSARIQTYQEVANTSSFSTTVYSSSGEANTLKMDFSKQVPSSGTGTSWDVTATILDEDDNVISTQSGVANFDEYGALVSTDLTTVDNNGSSISLNFGTPYDASVANSGFDGITAISSGSYGAGDIGKDGYKAGELESYALDDNGQIQANFSNDINIPVAKIAVFHFQNDQGLSSESGDYFTQTANSGEAIFYTDSSGNFINNTSINSYKLEMSNVELSTALTEVIVMQKAYDASSKSITTSDELLQNAINMKR